MKYSKIGRDVMAQGGSFSAKGLKELQKKLNKISDRKMDEFVDSCAKELAARLLSKVIKRTPVGEYGKNQKGKVGGTLRRGWTSKTYEQAKNKENEKVTTFLDGIKVNHFGGYVVIEIKNPVEYASYVEHGHRQVNRNHEVVGWTPGHHMLKISEREIQEIAPKVLEAKVKRFLGECFR